MSFAETPHTFTIISAATSTTGSSSWIDIGDYKEKSFDFYITGTATTKIWLTNNPSPTSGDIGNQFGSNVTSGSLITLNNAVRWVRVEISAQSSGTVSVYFHGNRYQRRPL